MANSNVISADFGDRSNSSKWVLDGVLPVGLNLLCGHFLSGKEYLATELAVEVASGGSLFGKFKATAQQCTFYLGLSHTKRKFKAMLKPILNGNPPPSNMSYAEEWISGDVDCDKLEAEIAKDNIRLVVIDTLLREMFLCVKSHDDLYRHIARLVEISEKHNVCILVLNENTDPGNGFENTFKQISDIYGVDAELKSVWALDRKTDTGRTYTLDITGRDIKDTSVNLIRANYRGFKLSKPFNRRSSRSMSAAL